MEKKIKYIIASLFCVMLFAACDDFLDTDNLTMKDTSNFPLNETDAYQMVNGIYAVMNRNLADPEEDPFFIFDIASDDRLGGGSQSNIGAQGVDRLMNAYVDWMKPLWQQRYAGINRANNALESIDNVTNWTSETTKKQYLCEIYFLRAWYYFNLAQVFNGVPLVLSTVPQNLPRSTADEVYAQIASDLKNAIEIGPSTKYPDFGEGRVSKWAAEGMMARVWLFYTGFYGNGTSTAELSNTTYSPLQSVDLPDGSTMTKQDVITAIDDCVNNSGYSLVDDFRNLWAYTNRLTVEDNPYTKGQGLKWVEDDVNNGPNTNPESMFAIKFNKWASWSTTIGYGNGIALHFGVRDAT